MDGVLWRALNEGRGVNPGVNEGRGVNPGDTRALDLACPAGMDAQRRPGREPRRHVTRRVHDAGRYRALNEGRGVNPGDTDLPA